MTEVEAHMALSSMAAAGDAPELSELEIAGCLRRARRPDAWGYHPIDAAYSLTYDLNHAAFLAWQLKAGKCASYHGIGMQGRSFDAGAVHDHCLKMMAEYRRYLNASVSAASCWPW
jgi:hypothetical protein